MEIKKGISQMPEFLNQEINYVVPSDGKMYYVLKDGILEDILSTTLNNLGVASSEYGVIKVYDVKIKFETKEGEF